MDDEDLINSLGEGEQDGFSKYLQLQQLLVQIQEALKDPSYTYNVDMSKLNEKIEMITGKMLQLENNYSLSWKSIFLMIQQEQNPDQSKKRKFNS